MIYSIYSGEECDPIHDIARLRILLEGLRLLEDDYLGGLGSRGSGKVELLDFKVRIRKQPLAEAKLLCEHASLSELCSGLDDLLQKVANELL